MAHPIDQTSFHLGVIFAFSEMVAADLKKMALSLPLLPKDYKRLTKDAKRIAREEGVIGGRTDAIQPCPSRLASRHGEWRAGDLLGIEAMRRTLRRVLADRKRACDRLAGEFVAEA